MPNFAAAWSIKAILLLQQYWFFDNNTETRDAARESIQHGRAIDPALPELDLAEGYYHYWGFRDYEKALPFIQKASVALPNNSRVHLARAYVLRRMGRWKETLAALQRASELDPRRVTTLGDIGGTLTSLRRFDEAGRMFARAQEIDSNDANVLWERTSLLLQESGDITRYAHLAHLMRPPHPDAQMDQWRSALYLDDFDVAQQDVDEWQQSFLDTKDFRMTRTYLAALTYLYSGGVETAQPLLLEAKQEFETLLSEYPDDFPVLRSLCFISGGLGELDKAQQYCRDSLNAAPKDAFLAREFKFNAAAGLALAGDAQAAVGLLKAMLDGDVGPTMYPVIYHPAFDGIREDPVYIELLKQYRPKTNQ